MRRRHSPNTCPHAGGVLWLRSSRYKITRPRLLATHSLPSRRHDRAGSGAARQGQQGEGPPHDRAALLWRALVRRLSPTAHNTAAHRSPSVLWLHRRYMGELRQKAKAAAAAAVASASDKRRSISQVPESQLPAPDSSFVSMSLGILASDCISCDAVLVESFIRCPYRSAV